MHSFAAVDVELSVVNIIFVPLPVLIAVKRPVLW